MKTSQFSEEKFIYFLKQAEAGVAVKDVCRQAGVSQATFYKWKNKFTRKEPIHPPASINGMPIEKNFDLTR